MRDDRFNSLKREFDGAPEDAAGALLSVADMMKAALFSYQYQWLQVRG